MATVLIVEDHPAVRASLTAWLSRALPTCRILAAASGEEALTLLDEAPILVLMDIPRPPSSSSWTSTSPA